MTRQQIAAVTLSALIGTGTGYVLAEYAGPVRVVNLCKVPGARCADLDAQPPALQAELEELILCCSYYDGNCSIVESLNSCHPSAEYAVICDWGRTLIDGSIECYD
jgi:hypothetical protein